MAELVTDGIREAIMNGELAPNARIKEAQMAARFGVSRSPVREAFRELAGEGFLEIEQDVGACVSSIDPEEVAELYLAREAIEPMMIFRSAQFITAEEIAKTKQLLELSEECARDDDIVGYIAVDHEMHSLLLASSGMKMLHDLTRGLWQRTQRYRFDATTADRLELSVIEHRLIVNAVELHQPYEAADYYRIHTRRTRLRLTESTGGSTEEHPGIRDVHNIF